MPSISFVVPLHNHLSHTQAMLTSLLASLPVELTFEVILVDDASSDGTADWLRQLDDPRLRWVINTENLGYAASNNRGVAEARGEILGLLNNDLIFSPGWLAPMLRLLNDRAGNYGLVGNVQRRVADGEIDHAGVCLNRQGQFMHAVELPTRTEAAIPWVTGACVLICREFFLSLGGFDTRYRNGCEDIDLCFRVRQAGKKVGTAYQSCIRHHVSLSRGGPSRQNELNSRLLFAKWRNEIKQALADDLRADWPMHPAVRDGELDDDFAATPHIACRLLAEQQIALHELYWERLFAAPETLIPGRLRVAFPGVEFTLAGAFPARQTVRLEISGAGVITALNLCGHLLPSSPIGELLIVIDSNGLHRKRFTIKRGKSFNLRFDEPLMLPSGKNVLFFTVDRDTEAFLPEILAALRLDRCLSR